MLRQLVGCGLYHTQSAVWKLFLKTENSSFKKEISILEIIYTMVKVDG